MPREPQKHVLEIVEQPGKTIAPKSGRRTKVRPGDTITFVPEHGVTNPKISFSGEVPFAGGVADYGRDLLVNVPHKPGGEAQNVYTFSCSFTKNGQPLHTPGGGELEVVSGDD